ncbi:adaptor protein MecA [uncultured Limosilactobacillus sp.]|uniref:adaptor protein MecA n=1 Tax=uncultured Limosilactobacillus sp. TaxID=2837629 RepID=UPI0025E21CD0|nr:adaptor protein MecA [uncultured Limosilactobacillus sp.]
MKMEHINENTIRVLLGSDDLSARGITVLDLLGNHKQIQDFFYSILDEVDTDHEFRDNEAVTFQVLPTRTGLELFISKADPESGDTNANNDAISRYIKREMVGKDQPLINPDPTVADKASAEAEPSDEFGGQPSTTRVVKFNHFEDVISVSHLMEPVDQMSSDLYKLDGQYFLILTFFNDGSLAEGLIEDVMAVLSEYAIQTAITADIIAEHGKMLMQHSAVERVRYYF